MATTWLRTRLPFGRNKYKPLSTALSRPSSTTTTTSKIPLNSKEHESFLLPDGRTLGYAEYGSPTGYPLIYFHGFPSSRLEARTLYEFTQRKDIRIITPDRPGFGLSTFQPHRRITDWPADVQALARHVNVKEYAILGSSGGGPYALACADQLWKDNISAIGIMGMRGPKQAGTEDIPRISKFVTWQANNTPNVLGALIMGVVGCIRWFPSTAFGQWWIAATVAEHEMQRTPEERERVGELRSRDLSYEAFAQGPEGFVHEARLLADDWGIGFEHVRYRNIQIWHEMYDKQAPVGMIRWMVERLPSAELVEFEDCAGGADFNIANHLEDILEELLPEEKVRAFERGA